MPEQRRQLLEAWNSFSREIIPADAPRIQRMECQRAFYAGAGAVVGVLKRAADGTEADVVDTLAEIDCELGDFVAGVRNGRS